MTNTPILPFALHGAESGVCIKTNALSDNEKKKKKENKEILSAPLRIDIQICKYVFFFFKPMSQNYGP